MLAALVALFSPAAAAAGMLNLGPEQIVQAGAGDLQVAGYSVPLLADFNNDGRKDLVVGEGGGGLAGKIRVYLNGGTATAPLFSGFNWLQSNGVTLVVPTEGCQGAFPRLMQFDADGNKDLLVGQADGTVRLFRNVGTDSEPTFDGGALLAVGPAGAKSPIDVGYRATIALTDWNNDGAGDLVLGALDGKIRLYLNEGTPIEPDFLSATILQGLAGDLVVPAGRSSPAVMDLDGDGKKDLLVGNTNGEILFYRNEGTDAAPSFAAYEQVVADGIPIDLPGSARSRPYLTDWIGDGLPDLLIGAGDGKVHLFQMVPEPAALPLLVLGVVPLLGWRGAPARWRGVPARIHPGKGTAGPGCR
ncbi:MAG: hypothetical protein A2W31_08640 [Planctomycetes bacterium RBG_16_64_10]|nr:MAG: hypothetical protein A2W31_08640 [Planctomycetes bacterium RBG_16_64_10]